MKIRIISCLALSAILSVGCSYNDSELWDAVNKQEQRISVLEKWQKSAVEQLSSLQGIITASDYITGVENVTKADGTKGYKFTFLHASPVTLYYNDKNEVSGSNNDAISVSKDESGKWFWTLNGQPLQIDGKTVYVSSGDGIKVNVNANGSTTLTIGNNEVLVPGPITHPVTGVTERDGVVTITLNGGQTIDVTAAVDLSKIMLDEYTHDSAGEQTYNLSLPDGYVVDVLGTVSAGWTVEVDGSNLKIVYPASGQTTVKFFVSDGKSRTIIKKVAFRVSSDISWVTVEYKGSPITIPSGTKSVKVIGDASSLAPATFATNVANAIKNAEGLVNVDLSELVYTRPISSSAFYINLPAIPERDKNTSIETIILPKGIINIWKQAFKNCVALKSVTVEANTTIPNAFSATWFEGCDALESIFVPADKVDTYKSTWDASIVSKIKPISK